MTLVSTGQLTLTDLNDTKQVILYLDPNYRTQIYDPNPTTYSPNFPTTNLVITPELYVAGGAGTNLLPSVDVQSLTWYVGTQTVTPITEGSTTDYTIPTGAVSTTAKPLSVKTNFTAKNNQVFTCVVVYRDSSTGFDITVKASVDIVKITNGQKGDAGVNAITAVVTNDSHSIPTDSAGNSPVYTGSGTEIHIYEGATELTYDGVGTANGTWTVTSVATAITRGTITDSGLFATVGIHSAITADTATITYTISGKRADGTAFSVVKAQTFNKTKNGVAGTSPTLYRFLPSANAIKKDVAGVYSPASLVLESKSQTGSGAISAYSGRFKIYTTTAVLNASTSWGTAVYTSGSDQSTYTYPASGVFPASITGIKIEMYQAGGTTVLLDSQVIPIVGDGATGIDSLYLNVWTPDGDTTQNAVGTLKVQADVYKGAGIVSATTIKWYQQDPSATTTVKGDTDGGAGWRLLQTIANPTVTPTVVASGTGGTVGAVAHWVKYTYVSTNGETIGNTTAGTVTPTSGQNIVVNGVTFPTGVTKVKVYMSTTSATAGFNYQGDITTSGGSYTRTTAIATTPAIPTSNTATYDGGGITNFTTNTITVPATAIAGIEGFKCVSVYGGTNYIGVSVLKDVTDPIYVDIIGVETFKNGQGSNVLTAQLRQNGAIISNVGYTFTWAIYNTAGTLTYTFPDTDDTITALATQITGKGVVVCDVSK